MQLKLAGLKQKGFPLRLFRCYHPCCSHRFSPSSVLRFFLLNLFLALPGCPASLPSCPSLHGQARFSVLSVGPAAGSVEASAHFLRRRTASGAAAGRQLQRPFSLVPCSALPHSHLSLPLFGGPSHTRRCCLWSPPRERGEARQEMAVGGGRGAMLM